LNKPYVVAVQQQLYPTRWWEPGGNSISIELEIAEYVPFDTKMTSKIHSIGSIALAIATDAL